MTEESLPLGGKVVTKPFLVLAVLALIGGILVIYRYLFGLGAVTNLSDGYPWGIWITYDVLVGTALGCGGYAMAILVYVLNHKHYHPLIRSAVSTSVFGYTLAGVAIFVDIGRYWNGYNLFLPWHVNFNSVLVEVALCIAAYVGILWLELAPALLEKTTHPKALILKTQLIKLLPIIVALGILLPTMHQSSLGSLMIIAGYKVSPLWQTGLLPLLFLMSAIIMGYAVTVVESLLSSIGFKRPLEMPLIAKVSRVAFWLVACYLVLRFADLIARGRLELAWSQGLKSYMFILENGLFLGPLIILSSKERRNNPGWLFTAAVSLLMAGSLYRFNVFLIGYDPGPSWSYFPAMPEILISMGIIAVELMGYLFFVKKFPVLPKVAHT